MIIRTDFETIKMKLGGVALEDMTAITFIGWIARKLNNQSTNSPIMNELTTLIKNPPMGKMSIENKLQIIRKLEALNIEIC